MAKSLVIVESPAKAKTINKYLGKDYVVKSSVGHIRDLVTGSSAAATGAAKKKTTKAKTVKSEAQKKKEAKQKLFTRMGVNPEGDWEANYGIIEGKEKVLDELKNLAEKVETIYLATDLDREGEAIAWHLREAIGGDIDRYRRVTFTEITKQAVQEAFHDPGYVNMDRVKSQQARRFLDRVVGFMLSPLLWAKVARGLSAGRVQSVAVRLIHEREREIQAFMPEEYWEVHVNLSSSQGDIRVQVTKENGENFRPTNEEEAEKAVAVLNSEPYQVIKREDKPTRSKPSAPFITSTLQQAASIRLGYGVKKTMMLAQRLYEAGHITYMRTDSTNLSKEAVETVRAHIQKEFGAEYLPEAPIRIKTKRVLKEAHEAIRPTDCTIHPAELAQKVESDEARLYDLIWRQTVACQMTPATYNSTSISVACGAYTLKARGRVLVFPGYLKVQSAIRKKGDEDLDLPDIREGASLTQQGVEPTQHFTKPPPRYTEAGLVKELEKQGIGRPSTYAAIITTIQERGYVKAEGRRFFCLKMGDIVTDRLTESFGDLMDYSFTSNLEEELDKVASGDLDWKHVLDHFYEEFDRKVDEALENMRANDPVPTDIPCPLCGRSMNIRTARTGVFLSCSGYELPPKERCKGTINLLPGEEVVRAADDDELDLEELQQKRRCHICGTAMDSYLIDEDRKLHVCGHNPECGGFYVEQGKFKIKGYDGPVITCDKCGADMQLKTGRFGKYFACNRAPECKNTRKLLRNGEPAPPKMDPIHMPELPCEKSDGYFVLRDGAAGLFLASSAFPKSRETKKPTVGDLVRHKEALDPKYHYITEAPETDEKGRPAVIRFSRKTGDHYLMTEDDGKATGWTAVYEGNAWKITKAAAKSKAKKTAKKTAAKKATKKTTKKRHW